MLFGISDYSRTGVEAAAAAGDRLETEIRAPMSGSEVGLQAGKYTPAPFVDW